MMKCTEKIISYRMSKSAFIFYTLEPTFEVCLCVFTAIEGGDEKQTSAESGKSNSFYLLVMKSSGNMM